MSSTYNFSSGWYTYRTLSVSTNVCCLPVFISLGKAARRPSMRERVISTNCREMIAANREYRYHIILAFTSMALCKRGATPVYQQWSYTSFTLSHGYHSRIPGLPSKLWLTLGSVLLCKIKSPGPWFNINDIILHVYMTVYLHSRISYIGKMTQSSEGIIIRYEDTNQLNKTKNAFYKSTPKSPREQCVHP